MRNWNKELEGGEIIGRANNHYKWRFFILAFCNMNSSNYINSLCQIFTLPKDTLIYPAHDYKGFSVRKFLHMFFLQNMVFVRSLISDLQFQVSTVGEEMAYNPRLTKDLVIS